MLLTVHWCYLKLEKGISGGGGRPASCDHHILVPAQHLLEQPLQNGGGSDMCLFSVCNRTLINTTAVCCRHASNLKREKAKTPCKSFQKSELSSKECSQEANLDRVVCQRQQVFDNAWRLCLPTTHQVLLLDSNGSVHMPRESRSVNMDAYQLTMNSA